MPLAKQHESTMVTLEGAAVRYAEREEQVTAEGGDLTEKITIDAGPNIARRDPVQGLVTYEGRSWYAWVYREGKVELDPR